MTHAISCPEPSLLVSAIGCLAIAYVLLAFRTGAPTWSADEFRRRHPLRLRTAMMLAMMAATDAVRIMMWQLLRLCPRVIFFELAGAFAWTLVLLEIRARDAADAAAENRIE